MMFRLSRRRVQRIFEDIMASTEGEAHRFYASSRDATGKHGASYEAKILLPLKTFAYGVPPHTFIDYFQMSKGLAASCCKMFAVVMKLIYDEEYLRLPDALDLKRIIELHKKRHGVNVMFGSLDCMHTAWKYCPKGWQALFKSGKETCRPTVVLEAFLADYHLWFWHASSRYAGSLNDLSILNLSPLLLESLVDGSLTELEQSSGLVPFDVAGNEFNRLFALVDGIYSPYSRFVKGIQLPLTEPERRYTAWQEAARKDIERAFGVLQSRFQVMARPFLGHSLKKISYSLRVFDYAQYVRVRQSHGRRCLCLVQSCEQFDNG
ncbi:Plant transposon protein [Fragilaria crotonensis]|nr:Plant transposon protein [Fragilaria crotonensis]